MADLEAVLADVSYLMAMEKSMNQPIQKASKRMLLPDASIRSVMTKYLEKEGQITFDKIFDQIIGYMMFKDFCASVCEGGVLQMNFYNEIKEFEKLESDEDRIQMARKVYDTYIMRELLSQSHIYSKESVNHVQDLLQQFNKSKRLPKDTFKPYLSEIRTFLKDTYFDLFLSSEKFTRFCQWKNMEFNISLTMNDFSVHRIIGRGGFGEVYGCRKADTGKMYAMKCLDKKRIKMKCGENLALNERFMLSLVSTEEGNPFIVCMTYAFQTTEKLCFLLDLMNGGDLHYHLTQHNVFSEKEVRFYASEVILGLEHMHNRFCVYRDLKPANILLDEHGHVRISDLGLACDFSKKKPTAGVGTHGYMAPEVIQKGQAYDSSADWFSLGCMIYKLLRGHSPFRQHRSKDKSEIDKMTLMMNLDSLDSMSPDMKNLIENLLQRDVPKRIGCRGQGAIELKEHVFFKGIDWDQVYQLKYPPPLIPPRGEVNAADAFDIGSFDEDDTKGVKLSESDQNVYKDFNVTVSEKWQREIADTIFDAVNQEMDKIENKRRQKLLGTNVAASIIANPIAYKVSVTANEAAAAAAAMSGGSGAAATSANATSSSTTSASLLGGSASASASASAQNPDILLSGLGLSAGLNTPLPNFEIGKSEHLTEWWIAPSLFGVGSTDCIVEGEVLKLGGPFMQTWQKKHLRLFPNRLELYNKTKDGIQLKNVELISMLDIKDIPGEFQKINKCETVILIHLKNDYKIYITIMDKVLINQWKDEILEGFSASNKVIANMNQKVHRMYAGIGEIQNQNFSSTSKTSGSIAIPFHSQSSHSSTSSNHHHHHHHQTPPNQQHQSPTNRTTSSSSLQKGHKSSNASTHSKTAESDQAASSSLINQNAATVDNIQR